MLGKKKKRKKETRGSGAWHAGMLALFTRTVRYCHQLANLVNVQPACRMQNAEFRTQMLALAVAAAIFDFALTVTYLSNLTPPTF